VTRLETGGTLIGAFPQAVFERGEIRLEPGDTVVLYSDGVSEAMNTAGDEFGEDRITATVAAVVDQPPQRVLDALVATLRDFTRDAEPHDDMTAVVLRYIAPRGGPDKARPTYSISLGGSGKSGPA
jgi:sigma-B regulation protein RsbU (phosphoserine phosphatase)